MEGEGHFLKLKKRKERKKENKARLKSSHRQARAPGVLSQARNYRTGSTAKCFIKGNSPPNSWRWAPASCVCLSISPSLFLSPPFSYLHVSISCSLALCIGRAHRWTSLEQRDTLDAEEPNITASGEVVFVKGCVVQTQVSWHWARGCWVAASAAAGALVGGGAWLGCMSWRQQGVFQQPQQLCCPNPLIS